MADDKIHKVYRLTFPSGLVYIGLTRKTLPGRMTSHRQTLSQRRWKHSKLYQHWAASKDPVVEVVASFSNLQEAETLEKSLIRSEGVLNSLPGGSPTENGTGNQNSVGKRSLKVRANMSKARIGNSNAKGFRHSEETKARIRATLLNRGGLKNA